MKAATSPVRAEPNVTPMIDVMLVLLIIFMTVAPMLESGFHATPPSGKHLSEHPDEDGDAVIGLDAHGQYYFNKRPTTEDALARTLSERFLQRPGDRVVFLRADQGLRYDRVQSAMTLAANAGARFVGLISEQSPSGITLRQTPVAAR